MPIAKTMTLATVTASAAAMILAGTVASPWKILARGTMAQERGPAAAKALAAGT
jgi:hypothetical protein